MSLHEPPSRQIPQFACTGMAVSRKVLVSFVSTRFRSDTTATGVTRTMSWVNRLHATRPEGRAGQLGGARNSSETRGREARNKARRQNIIARKTRTRLTIARRRAEVELEVRLNNIAWRQQAPSLSHSASHPANEHSSL